MGDEVLRCSNCSGKFGPVVGDQRCGLCGLLHRYQTLLVSDRFPGVGGQFALPELQGAYHKALEIAESYHQHQQGGAVPPRSSDSEAPGVGGVGLQTTPKAKPPIKGEVEEKSVVVKEEIEESSPKDTTKERSPLPRRYEGPKKEKKSRPRDPSGGERARSSGIRRGERSRSPRQRRVDSREERPRRGDSKVGKRSPPSPRGRERRERSGGRREGAGRDSRRKSPLRPRSPPGPPPPRSPPGPPPQRRESYQRWQGPIPAYSNRGHHQEWDNSRPEPQNKGVKKRKQQRLFSEFKAWRKNQRRHQRRG